MASSALFALLLAGTASANPAYDFFQNRQTDPAQSYFNQVCLPETPSTATVIPPCISIANIESSCLPNATSPLALIAHAECLCGGSFFADQIGCINCGFVHGQRSPKDVSDFQTILSSVSNALCTGTPTAAYATLFSNINAGYPHTGSNIAKTDLHPSDTAIGLYYTASGSQGPGPITGAAASATKTTQPPTGPTVVSTSKSTGTSKSATGVSTSASVKTSSTSSAGAAQTGAWMGVLGVVAGGIAIAAL